MLIWFYVRSVCFLFLRNAEVCNEERESERQRERSLMRKREAWLFPLHDFSKGVSARIFETLAKWPVGSTSLLGLCLWLTLFWEKGWGPPCDSHQGTCDDWEWLVRGGEGVVVHAGAKARCVLGSGLCSLRLPLRRPRGLHLHWGPRCASCCQHRA